MLLFFHSCQTTATRDIKHSGYHMNILLQRPTKGGHQTGNLRDLLFLHYNQPFNFTKSAIIKSYLFKKSLQTFSINRSPMAQKKRRGKEQYYTSFYLNKISINFYNSNVVTERRDKEKYLLCLLKNTNTTRVDSYSRACIFKKFFLHKPLFMSP